VDFCNLSRSVSKSSHTINGLSSPTVFYSNNDACVKWLHNMTSKAACHIKLRENSIQEWVQGKTLNIVHVAGKVNPANMFTKEMKDSAHFCCLKDFFMMCLSDFVNESLLDLHHDRQRSPKLLLLLPLSVLPVGEPLIWPLLHPFFLSYPVKSFPP
jgi:hypothetical protein